MHREQLCMHLRLEVEAKQSWRGVECEDVGHVDTRLAEGAGVDPDIA